MATETAPSIPAGLAKWLAARNPTPAQRDVVTAYLRLRDAGDGVVNPTQSEIADALGVARSCVNEHVGHLIDKGVFSRQAYKRGGLRLLWDERDGDDGRTGLRAEARLVATGLREIAGQIRKTFPGYAHQLAKRADQLDTAVNADGRETA